MLCSKKVRWLAYPPARTPIDYGRICNLILDRISFDSYWRWQNDEAVSYFSSSTVPTRYIITGPHSLIEIYIHSHSIPSAALPLIPRKIG